MTDQNRGGSADWIEFLKNQSGKKPDKNSMVRKKPGKHAVRVQFNSLVVSQTVLTRKLNFNNLIRDIGGILSLLLSLSIFSIFKLLEFLVTSTVSMKSSCF